MRAGFVQNLTVTRHRGGYPNNVNATSELEGHTFWDTRDRQSYAEKFYHVGAGTVFEDATANKNRRDRGSRFAAQWPTHQF